MRFHLAIAAAAMCLAASSLAAATPWIVTLKKNSGGPTADLEGLKAQTTGSANDVAADQSLTIKCVGYDCTKDVQTKLVTEEGTETKLTAKEATQGELTFKLQPMTATLLIGVAGTTAPVVTASLAPGPNLEPKVGDDGKAPPKVVENVSTRELLATSCPKKPFKDLAYDRHGNRATVVVSPGATPMTALPVEFDENDSLKVIVRGDSRLLPLLRVTRKSAFRELVGSNILGDKIPIPVDVINRHRAADDQCGEAEFVLRDFAAGRAVVQIQALSGDTAIDLGELDFNVRPLYSGMFSLGALWTPLVDPKYEVAMRDGKSVIVASETGSRRMSYVFLYTPFLWDMLERDIRKPRQHWYEYVNPSVGFVLNDPLDNVLLGATADVHGAIALTAGLHFSRVERLEGVAVGDPFEGDASALPISHQWKRDWFLAVTVDLRAATSLIRTVLGTAAN